MNRTRRCALKLVGLPSWEVELVDGIVKPSDGENWAHNNIIISFKSMFALPPQDYPDCVVIQRTFSAPLQSLVDNSGINSRLCLIDRMFESMLLPFFSDCYELIIDGVNRIADAHRADLSAGTPIALRMNVIVCTLLHEIPSIYFEFEGGESGHVIDIVHLYADHSESVDMCVEQVIPHYHYNLPYDERERIFQRTRYRRYSELDSFNDDVDPSRDEIVCLPASEDEDFIERLEKVTIDVASISIECSICLEDISVATETTRLPCSHLYHANCIIKWLENSKFCPLCRFELP